MCKNKIIIRNKRYQPTKKNGYTKETPRDRRLSYIEIPCGECKECKKKRKEMWRLRIENELLDSKSAIFFTGTFSDEAIENIKKQYGVKEENDIATKANRLFLERLRKKYNIKLTHWCITELGSKKGRIHIHGIFFIKENQDVKYIKDKIKREWDFGWNYLGYVDQGKTINYITKYMLKENENFKEFKPKVLASQKIGIGFIEKNKRFYKYIEKNGKVEANTKMEYLDGRETYLIKYYKEKLYTTEERENILLSILDENKRKINSRVFKGYDLETELEYNRFLIQERAVTERLEPIKEEERTLRKKIRRIKKEIEYKNLDKETLLKKMKISEKRAEREQAKYKMANKAKKITENDENKNIFIELWKREIEKNMFNKIKNSEYEKHFEIDNVPNKINSIAEAFKIIKERYKVNDVIKLKEIQKKGGLDKKVIERTIKIINVNINREIRKEIEILKQKTLYEENLHNDNNMLFYDNPNDIVQCNKNPSKGRK